MNFSTAGGLQVAANGTAPKLYWVDTGLASHIAGIQRANALRSSRLLGRRTPRL